MQPAGPFSIVPASAGATTDLQRVTSTSANAQSGDCEGPSSLRNLVIQKSCSNAYGAAMRVLEEVN